MNNLAIIILNWNNKELTDKCVNSIKRQTFKDYTIFVVDNDSTDGSVPFLKNLHKDIEIIANDSNLGYAAGNNVGIKYVLDLGYKYIFILNNDVELFPDVLDPLVCLLEKDKKTGVVAPLALNYYEDKRDAEACSLYGGYNFLSGTFNPYQIDKNEPTQVKIAIGCALMFKRDVFEKCGFFDERFYMYFEENDLLTSVSDSGYSILVQPSAKIYHREGSSSRFSKFPKNYYSTRNQLLFHKKHSSLFIFLSYMAYYAVKLPFFLFRKKNIRDLRLNLAGIRDFFRNKYYKTDIIRSADGFFY